MEQWETFERGRPRAPRFVLALPLRYREQGEDGWEVGSMCNISRSGLLFTTQRSHQPTTRIELTFALPSVIRNEPPGTVRCWGEIVRSEPWVGKKDDSVVAMRILDYEFMRAAAPLVDQAEVAKRGC